MKLYNFKVKTSNLTYPILQDEIIKTSDNIEYNFLTIKETLKDLYQLYISESSSVQAFNDAFNTSEDESISWTDFDMQYFHNSTFLSGDDTSDYMYIVQIQGNIKYGINNITGTLEIL